MVKKLLISFFIISILAYYDKAVSLATEYNVNLDILYFGGWHLFGIMVFLVFSSMHRYWFEKIPFYIASFILCFNLIQNLLALNHNYYRFKEIVNSIHIDQIKWVLLIAFLTSFVLWGSIKYHRK